MSDFHDQFRPDPDPEMGAVRRVWMTDKPIFRDAVVAYAPPYPEYPRLKLSRSGQPSSDPSCPSAREPSDELEVALYCSNENGFGDYQENAWNFITEHAASIEASLRRKLFAQHLKFLTAC